MNLLISMLQKLSQENESLSLERLCMKCIILFKIVTMARSADVMAVSWKSLQCFHSKLSGCFNKTKNYQRGYAQHFEFSRIEDHQICIVSAWYAYIEQTRVVPRPKDRVFLNCKEPFFEIGRERIAKITLEAMKETGVDTNRFKAHSTRMSSASKAIDKGASVDAVMRCGRWRSRQCSTCSTIDHRCLM
jgi:integrase